MPATPITSAGHYNTPRGPVQTEIQVDPSTGLPYGAGNPAPVSISAPAPIPIVPPDISEVDKFRNDYSSTAVTTAAYIQVLASTSAEANKIEIFDSSGQTLVLAFGAVGVEVDQIYIIPGGNGQVALHIPASTRLSVKAVSANATSGELTCNTYTN